MRVSSVVKWVSDEVRGVFDGKYCNVKMPFKPYFFVNDVVAISVDLESEFKGVEEVEPTDLRSADKKDKVYLVRCVYPPFVGMVRDEVEKLYPRSTYEADITYSRRIFIDNAFEVYYDDSNVMFLDVELDDSEGFKEFGEMPFLSYAIFYRDKFDFKHVKDFDSEWELLYSLYNEIVSNGVSVVVGWNVDFDLNHFSKRVKVLREQMDKKTRKSLPRIYDYNLSFVYGYDLRNEYKGMVKGLVGYSLDEVAKNEGLGSKFSRSGKVSEMSYSDLRDYNLRDVEILVDIEKRYGFVERDKYLCREVNLPMNFCKVVGVLGDCLVLRRLRELGYVSPNSVKHKKTGYEGALTIEPRPGLYEKVLCMDVVSLYPTAILDLNVDILDFAGQVLPYLVAKFFRRKMEEEEKGNKVGRETYKILSNAIYGLFGYEFFRFFDERKASMITKRGREVLMKMKKVVEDVGLDVLYGDTDSLFVKVDGVESPEALIDYVNSQISPYRVSMDMLYDKIIFFGYGESGVKKRYVGVSGNKWKIRGIELRRGDWSMFSKRVVWDVVKMIFDGKSRRDIETYLANIKSRLYKGEFDDELKMVKSVRQGRQYKVLPAHYKLWLNGVKLGLIPRNSSEVEFYYRRGVGDGLVLGLWNEINKVFDYDEYWKKQVLAPVGRIISSVWRDDGSLSLEKFLG